MRCVYIHVDVHRPWGCAHSLATGHTPQAGACGLSSLQDDLCQHFPVDKLTPWMGGWSVGEETGAAAAGEFPTVPGGSFSFWENPPAQSCGSFCTRKGLSSHTAHLSSSTWTVWFRVPHSPTLNSPQPTPMVSMGLPLPPYSPPWDFKQPGLSWCYSSLVWQRRRPLTWLSSRSPEAGPAWAGLGLQPPWSLRWSHGPFCPEAIPLPSVFSVSSVLLGLLSS